MSSPVGWRQERESWCWLQISTGNFTGQREHSASKSWSTVILDCFPIAVIKATWEERVYVSLKVIVCHWGKPGKELKAGTGKDSPWEAGEMGPGGANMGAPWASPGQPCLPLWGWKASSSQGSSVIWEQEVPHEKLSSHFFLSLTCSATFRETHPPSLTESKDEGCLLACSQDHIQLAFLDSSSVAA